MEDINQTHISDELLEASLASRSEQPPASRAPDETVIPEAIPELSIPEPEKAQFMHEEAAEFHFDVPPGYNETKITLMVRDPYWLFSYWELSGSTVSHLQNSLGWETWSKSRKVLRVYDVTDVDFMGSNAWSHFDIDIGDHAQNWYINVPNPDRAYCVDLGAITEDGRFITISRSNISRTPPAGISDLIDSEWMTIEGFDQIYWLSSGIGLSSPELIQPFMHKQYKAEFLMGSEFVSSISSPGLWAPQAEKNFWLVADTELIVYGATEPDARVTIQGFPINLRPDGTFTARFALPDGEQVIGIRAVSSDETMERSITPVVNRRTYA